MKQFFTNVHRTYGHRPHILIICAVVLAVAVGTAFALPASEGAASVAVQVWEDNTSAIATNTGQGTLSRSGSNGVPQTAVIQGVTAGGYSNHLWRLNGRPVTALEENATAYTFDSAGRGNGTYNIGLMVEKDGEWFSTTIPITVQD